MKKNNKLALLSAITVTAGIGLFSANVNADTYINAAQYTQDAQQLNNIFTNKNKDYSLQTVTVMNNKNKDNKQEPVYKLVGFNKDKTKEVLMKVDANKTSNVVKDKTGKMDSKDKKKAEALDIKDVKKNPTDAINLAKKYANDQSNPTQWTLTTWTHKDKKIPVYKVVFEKNNNANASSASSAKSSSKEKVKKTIVKVNATTGDRISVKDVD